VSIDLDRLALALCTPQLSHSRFARSLSRKKNVNNRHAFVAWPIGGHDFMAVRIVHLALQMYVEHFIKSKESRAVYLDAIKCWPVRPSVQSIIDATQMYLDDKEKYRIKISMPFPRSSDRPDVLGGMESLNMADMISSAAGAGCSVQ